MNNTKLFITAEKCRQKAGEAYNVALEQGLHEWEARDIFQDVYKQELLKNNIYVKHNTPP